MKMKQENSVKAQVCQYPVRDKKLMLEKFPLVKGASLRSEDFQQQKDLWKYKQRFFMGKTCQIKVWGGFVLFSSFATFLGSVSEILLLRVEDLMSS